MDKVATAIKGFFASFFALVTSIFGILAIPILLMVGANITDYITGLMASNSLNIPIKSRVGINGIFKKIGMWILVLVGFGLDKLFAYSVNQFGINMPNIGFICALVVIWITINEFISILENLAKMDVPVPNFLLKLITYFKKTIEDKAEIIEEEVK